MTIRTLADDGMAVLLVEQFATLTLAVADEAVVLAGGQITFSGPAAGLTAAPDHLYQAYLGTEPAPSSGLPVLAAAGQGRGCGPGMRTARERREGSSWAARPQPCNAQSPELPGPLPGRVCCRSLLPAVRP